MKKVFEKLGIIAIAVIIGFIMVACGGGEKIQQSDLDGTWKNGVGKRPNIHLQYEISKDEIVYNFTGLGGKLVFTDLKWEQIPNKGEGNVPADIATYPRGFKITGVLTEKTVRNVRNVGDKEVMYFYLNDEKTEFWNTDLSVENNPFVKQ